MPGVGVSATSGFVRFRRITDFELSQPPMKISIIGSLSTGPDVNAMWASFGERTLKLKSSLRTGWKLYSNLSGVSSAGKRKNKFQSENVYRMEIFQDRKQSKMSSSYQNVMYYDHIDHNFIENVKWITIARINERPCKLLGFKKIDFFPVHRLTTEN